METKIEKKVMAMGQIFNFHLVIHQVSLTSLLVHKDFYIEFGELPVGIHHEIEVVFPKEWNPNLAGVTHIMTSKTNGRKFICYPRLIPSVEKARIITDTWCVGTAYTLVTGRDFQEIESLTNPDRKVFFQEMKEKYSVWSLD